MPYGSSPIQKVAMLVGGGPAPGINGVINAVTIQCIENHGIEAYGIQGQPWKPLMLIRCCRGTPPGYTSQSIGKNHGKA